MPRCSAPERLSKAYCPKHGDVTGQTFYGRGVGVVGQAPPPEREWCRCGWAVERVTYVREPWRRGFRHGYRLALDFALDQLEPHNPCHDRVRDALLAQKEATRA